MHDAVEQRKKHRWFEMRDWGLPNQSNSWTVRAINNVLSHIITNLSVTVLWVYFRLLNHTTVLGKGNAGYDRNTLLVSNHQSMIDSFPVGLFAFFPQAWLLPHLRPWNPAAVENFYKTPILAWLANMWRCVPVKPGRRDLKALNMLVDVLPRGVMTLFPEGARTRDGSVGAGRPGLGMLIMRTRPKVVPVAIDGMQDILPIGAKIPRVFKRLIISYGKPIDYSEFLDREPTREIAQELTDKVMDQVRKQHEEIRKMRRKKQSGAGDPDCVSL